MQEFKVLLVNPLPASQVSQKQLKYHRRFPPLSFLTTAQMLRDLQVHVELIDLQVSGLQSLDSAVARSAKFDLIVFTTNPYADWQCPNLQIDPILRQAKAFSGSKLVLTGNHGTHFPTALMQATGAHFVIREEEEWGIIALVDALRQGLALETLPGISYRTERGNFCHNMSLALPSLRELPRPAYDLIDVRDYNYELLGGNFALLEASRGCPFSCNFCNRSMFQNKYRKSQFEKLTQSIEELVERKNCQSIYFFDLEFTINKKMVEDICHFLIGKNYVATHGLKWCCQTRADSVDLQLCQLMKKAGCELIHFGVESGDSEILAKTNKRITLEKIETGVQAAHQAGISTAAFFIYGHPNETDDQRTKTLQFALKLNTTYASFHGLIAFPGSPLFESKYGKGPYWDQPLPQDWTYHPPELDQRIRAFCKKSFLRYYLRPSYAFRAVSQSSGSILFKQAQLFWSFLRA